MGNLEKRGISYRSDCQARRFVGSYASSPRMRRALRVSSLPYALFAVLAATITSQAETAKSGTKVSFFRLRMGLRSADDVDSAPTVRRAFSAKDDPTGIRKSDPEIRRAIPLPPRPALPARPQPDPSRRLPSSSLQELGVQPTSFTPYDRYMTGARSVFEQADGLSPTLAAACRFVEEGRAFRYVSCDPYRPDSPEVTAERRAGDCKSKALWLYKRLNDPSALYVIGKAEKQSKTSHAWVYWRYEGRWWILDPTTRSTPIAASSVSSSRYVPYYSFSRDGAYRHEATRIFGAHEEIPAVAQKRFLFFPISQSSADRSR